MSEQHRSRLGRPVEEREPVAARLRRVEQLAVVHEVEPTGHYSVSTYSFSAADSASSSACTLVSPVAIT